MDTQERLKIHFDTSYSPRLRLSVGSRQLLKPRRKTGRMGIEPPGTTAFIRAPGFFCSPYLLQD